MSSIAEPLLSSDDESTFDLIDSSRQAEDTGPGCSLEVQRLLKERQQCVANAEKIAEELQKEWAEVAAKEKSLMLKESKMKEMSPQLQQMRQALAILPPTGVPAEQMDLFRQVKQVVWNMDQQVLQLNDEYQRTELELHANQTKIKELEAQRKSLVKRGEESMVKAQQLDVEEQRVRQQQQQAAHLQQQVQQQQQQQQLLQSLQLVDPKVVKELIQRAAIKLFPGGINDAKMASIMAMITTAPSCQAVSGIEDEMNEAAEGLVSKASNEEIQDKIEEVKEEVTQREEIPIETNKVDDKMKTVQKELLTLPTAEDEKQTEAHDAETLRNHVKAFKEREEALVKQEKDVAAFVECASGLIVIATSGLVYGVIFEASKPIMFVLVLLLLFAGIFLSIYISRNGEAENRRQANRDALIASLTPPPTYEERTIRMSKANGVFGTSHDVVSKTITKVTPGSPADLAGIKIGDSIVSINDYNVEKLKLATINDMTYYENEEFKFVIRTRAI